MNEDGQNGQPEDNAEERINAIRNGQKMRTDIVIIDDKEEDRFILKTSLEGCGYKVMSIKDARKVTQVLSGQKMSWAPEAFIVDLMLSGSSGYEVIRNIKPRFESKKVPIVVVSSLAGQDDIFEAQAAGAHAFVAKPYTPVDLLDAISFSIENFKKPMTERKTSIYVKEAAGS